MAPSLSLLSRPVEAIVKVTILDAENREVFEEKITSNGKFIRPYNLSELPKGVTRFVLMTKRENTWRNFATPIQVMITQVAPLTGSGFVHITKLSGAENKYVISIPYQGDAEVAIRIYDTMNT